MIKPDALFIAKPKIKTLILLAVLVILAVFMPSKTAARAEDSGADTEKELSRSVEEITELVDTAELEEFLNSLDAGGRSVFGSGSVADKIKRITSGELKVDYGSFLSYIMDLAGVNVLRYLPLIASVLSIVIAFSLISSVKSRFASDSVESIVHFASVALVTVIVLSQTVVIVNNVSGMITSMQKQMNVVFPIILTMMAASGAASSAAVYQPSVAILAGGITEIIALIIIPFFILSTVFTVVGGLSEGVKLKKMSDFFSSAAKWLLGTSFFVFGAFLSVQGVTASVYDGVSVRTAKFAVSKYVPIIGGYLSEGLNLVMAGSVLVKNAVGLTAVVLLFLTLVPVLAQVVVFNLSLSLAGAIAEPLGGGKISGLLTGLAKNMNMLIAVLLGTAFMYFIFLILVISTGNMIL